ncbi:hypothetical protein B9T39_01040 [Alloscardovia macacae]|uniref:DUF4191 domain-containing protein n=1 Tax=Alloscardovia macacae TaxID=1160091 RepID=A0A1Y2T0B6_9BIFI|nr:DUF4191 domain-containing protein [Alloscardovia macacae]OTA29983.1 hypothetical protein B9T39_01040 [Alloscardovia macacae]
MADEQKKPRRNNIFRQMKQLYDFTRQDDPHVTAWVAGAFLIPFVVVILLGLPFQLGWFAWILNVILAFMVGLLAATFVLSRRSETVGYKRIEGNPGAAGAVLQSLSKRIYTFEEQPVWVDPRTKDMIWRGTSLYGVYLVSEGPTSRVAKAVESEKAKIRRVTQGSNIRIIVINTGNDEGQVCISELSKAMRKRYKGTLTSDELDHLNGRLRTLQRMAGMGIPGGIDPRAAQHQSRRAMRGR